MYKHAVGVRGGTVIGGECAVAVCVCVCVCVVALRAHRPRVFVHGLMEYPSNPSNHFVDPNVGGNASIVAYTSVPQNIGGYGTGGVDYWTNAPSPMINYRMVG